MWSPAKDLRETAGEKTVYLTVEEARLFWAAPRWLDVYLTIGVGIEKRRYTIEQCIEMLRGAVEAMKAQPEGEKTVVLSRQDINILSDATVHLDRFCISREKPPPRKFPKGAKKK